MFVRLKKLAPILGLFVGIAAPMAALAQTASLLPNAVQQYFKDDGTPAATGRIYYYVPNTTTLKTTWKDSSKTQANPNPVLLDAAGRPDSNGAGTFGDGSYRQVLQDADGNTIWDAVTSSTGAGSTSSLGYGVTVGTILPWAGMALPGANYKYADGSTISRTTYPAYVTAVTQVYNTTCLAGSTNLTGLSETLRIPVGAKVEGGCIPPNTSVLSKTSTSLTLSNAATASISTSIRVFPWGNGDGATTITLPNMKGRVPFGRNNMDGTNGPALLSTYYGANPNAVGAYSASPAGQSATIRQNNLPVASFAVTGNTTVNVVRATGFFTANTGAGPYYLLDGVNNSTVPISGTASSGGSDDPISIVNPGVTVDYVVKVAPDAADGACPPPTTLALGCVLSSTAAAGAYVSGLDTSGNLIYSSLPLGLNYPIYNTLSAAMSASVATGTNGLYTLSYNTVGDYGGAFYSRVSCPVAQAWQFQSADGQCWSLQVPDSRPEMFGAKGDDTTDDYYAVQYAISYACQQSPRPRVLLSKTYYGSQGWVVSQACGNNGFVIEGNGIRGSQLRVDGAHDILTFNGTRSLTGSQNHCGMTSASAVLTCTLTSSDQPLFDPTDVGQQVTVWGACTVPTATCVQVNPVGPVYGLRTTIAAYTSSTVVTLALPALATTADANVDFTSTYIQGLHLRDFNMTCGSSANKGIVLRNVQDSTITGLGIFACNDHNIFVHGRDGLHVDFRNLRMSAGSGASSTTAGIRIAAGTNYTVDTTYFSGLKIGLDSSGDTVRSTNNIYEGATVYCLQTAGSDFTSVGDYFNACPVTTGSTAAINITADSSTTIITPRGLAQGNISRAPISNARFIYLSDSGGTPVTCLGSGTVGQYCASSGTMGVGGTWTTPGGGGGGCATANPTAQVGLTAVNGVSANCMRADGAPALDQGISPTWTAAHTFVNNINLTPGTATIAADQNNYALTTGTIVRLTPTTANRTITGMVAPATTRYVIIANPPGSGWALTLADQSASSSAANRFQFGADVQLLPGQSIQLYYSLTDSKWEAADTPLRNSGVVANTYGAQGKFAAVTVNQQGLVTSATDGTLTTVNGTTYPASYTSGGIPYASSSSSILSSGVLTANSPVIGGGAGSAPTVGTRSGNTTTFGTTSGALVSGNCAKFDASGNIVDSGAGCGSGSGITNLATGAGLTGGPITTTGTVSMLFDPASITNCTLQGTVAGNNLTVALKTQAGANPSASSPCVISFRSATLATGDYTAVSVTAATSVQINSGSTLGATNAVPFRVWVTAWNNAGTVVLGVSNHSTANNIYPILETIPASSTACSSCASATSAGVYYTTAAQTTKAIRILGYMDWTTGLTTAGTWNTAPDTIAMQSLGAPTPGKTLQTAFVNTGSTTTTTGSNVSTAVTLNITPTTTISKVTCNWQGPVRANNFNSIIVGLFRNAGLLGQSTTVSTPVAAIIDAASAGVFMDTPSSTSSTTYVLKITSSNATDNVSMFGGHMTCNEMMG